MLIALISDSHFDPGHRWEECLTIHDWIVDDMRARGVDLMLHSGDVNEGSTTPEQRLAVCRWFQRVAETCRVIVVRGNHDKWRDLAILERLRSKHRITCVEGAEMVHDHRGVDVACLAWPRRTEVIKLAAERGLGHEGQEQIAGEALRAILRGFAGQWRDGCTRILLSHAMVRGSKTSAGQPLVGCDLEVGIDDLRCAQADFYGLGHIHKPQEWPGWSQRITSAGQESWPSDIVYAGSPRRTAYGEVEAKGYVIYDTAARTWERIPTPCAAMYLHTGSYDDGRLDFGEIPINVGEGAEVRLRYEVDADRTEAARAEAELIKAELLAAGAVDVKIDPVTRSTVKAKVPEVAAAKTIAAKLGAYWDSRDDAPPPDRRERLLGMLGELESEAQ